MVIPACGIQGCFCEEHQEKPMMRNSRLKANVRNVLKAGTLKIAGDTESSNHLVGVVKAGRVALFAVGVNFDDRDAWPLTINLLELHRHVHLTRTAALRLAEVLTATAELVDVQCRKCSEVEDAPVHRMTSRKWTHDYDEQAIGVRRHTR